MKKGQLPIFAELTLADNEDSTAKVAGKFAGTDNLMHLAVIHALLIRPRKHEEIDCIAGASLGLDVIADLRRFGLNILCRETPEIDRNGYPIQIVVYALDDNDRRKLAAWMRKIDKVKGTQAKQRQQADKCKSDAAKITTARNKQCMEDPRQGDLWGDL